MLILGIETSCDETAIAILEKIDGKLSVLSNVVSSQIALHAKWGGVVPNLAAREHLKNIIPVLKSALKEANKKMEDIDLISVTQGPGLIPALLIGTNFAKTLSYIYQKPLLGIHHIEGHIYANWIGVNSKLQITNYKQIQKEQILNFKQEVKQKEEIKFPVSHTTNLNGGPF
ncbi:MAG: putative tRNA threonylcarbamoyladenosine biosynthesis protein Gcp [Candidatus Moranbacteria bacterium GW2011_GWF2_34_56]|nr:MAG: putative tRNA threonylcarbamoyladenosine biosynthesis protein Gcp [Candidatus Moranbacteria bacterium GW2011_GWF2_34_56]